MFDFLYKSRIKTRKFDYVTSRLDIDLDLGFSIALDHTSGPLQLVCIEDIKISLSVYV